MAETPIGVTDAGDQFDFEGGMQFAPAVVEDLFKNSMIWCRSAPSISLELTVMKIVRGDWDLWKLSRPL